MSFTVTAGLHTKGDCVVIHHGDIEVWVPLEEAEELGMNIVAMAKREKREIRAIRKGR